MRRPISDDRFKTMLAIMLVLVGLMGCAAPSAPAAPVQIPGSTIAPSTGKLKAIATFSVIADLAQNIGGDRVDIATLVGAGGDAHDFEPTPSDAAKIADAAVIFENGLGFESWLSALYASSGSRALRVVASANVATRAAGDHSDIDPHIWQDPRLTKQMVLNIRDGLAKADAANAIYYTGNADAYLAKLDALDADIVKTVNELPPEQRKLVTSHDALGYFAARYGFTVVGEVIASVSTEAGEPSAQDLVKLVDGIKQQGVKAIFVESITNPALVERVAQEAGVQVGPPLYTDALGPAGSNGATYLDAMRYNARTIVEALR